MCNDEKYKKLVDAMCRMHAGCDDELSGKDLGAAAEYVRRHGREVARHFRWEDEIRRMREDALLAEAAAIQARRASE